MTRRRRGVSHGLPSHPERRAAEAAATEIAVALQPLIAARSFWDLERAQPLSRKEPEELPHSYVPVAVFAKAVLFSIFVDRTLAPKDRDRPQLIASFELLDRTRSPEFERLVGDRARPRQYGPLDAARLDGLGGADVLEVALGGFLSKLRPSGDYRIEPALEAFRDFFERWEPRIHAAFGDRATNEPDLGESYLSSWIEGLVGELAVLRQPRWQGAEWLGPSGADHDIEKNKLLVEVKTSVGTDRDPVLSLRQITSGSDPSFYFAMVDLPASVLRVLAHPETAPREHTTDPVVLARKSGIGDYLQLRPREVDDALLRALSFAVSQCTIHWCRLTRPPEWTDAVAAVERLGPLVEFRQRCKRDRWFEPCDEPDPDRATR